MWPGLFGSGKIQHALDRQQALARTDSSMRIVVGAVSSTLAKLRQPFIAIHGQCAHDWQWPFAGSRRFQQDFSGGGGVHLVEDAVCRWQR